MSEHVRLLPANATPWMLATAEANDPLSTLGDRYLDIRAAFRNTPPDFLPFVVWQLGLGELSPFLPNLYDLIEEGVRWQRVRGTPAAISRGLGWLGYAGTLEEEPTRRRRWNRFQIELSRVRDADLPDLRRIDGVVSLSPPERSIFYRGFRGYDVRAAELSYKKLSRSILSSHSGVRIDAGKAKWSFGRKHGGQVSLDETVLTTLDAWLEPVAQGDRWAFSDYPWVDADFLWSFPGAQARRAAIAAALVEKSAYIRFATAGGAVIGYRRASLRPVRLSPSGEYVVSGETWGVSATNPVAVLARAMTGFGEGSGQVAASMTVVFDPTLAPGVKPGVLWLTAAQASGGIAVDPVAASIPFGITVREECAVVMLLAEETSVTEAARGLTALPDTYVTLRGQTAPGAYSDLLLRTT